MNFLRVVVFFVNHSLVTYIKRDRLNKKPKKFIQCHTGFFILLGRKWVTLEEAILYL